MKIYLLICNSSNISEHDITCFLRREDAEAEMLRRWKERIEQAEFTFCNYSKTSASVVDGNKIYCWSIQVERVNTDVAVNTNVAVCLSGGQIQSIYANSDLDVDVYDMDDFNDVLQCGDAKELAEAERRKKELEQIKSSPDYHAVW